MSKINLKKNWSLKLSQKASEFFFLLSMLFFCLFFVAMVVCLHGLHEDHIVLKGIKSISEPLDFVHNIVYFKKLFHPFYYSIIYIL